MCAFGRLRARLTGMCMYTPHVHLPGPLTLTPALGQPGRGLAGMRTWPAAAAASWYVHLAGRERGLAGMCAWHIRHVYATPAGPINTGTWHARGRPGCGLPGKRTWSAAGHMALGRPVLPGGNWHLRTPGTWHHAASQRPPTARPPSGRLLRGLPAAAYCAAARPAIAYHDPGLAH